MRIIACSKKAKQQRMIETPKPINNRGRASVH